MFIGIDGISVWLIFALSLVVIMAIILMPTGAVLWFIGPVLGIMTVALSVLGENTKNIPDLLNCMYEKKLSDLYLIAVITSAAATADAFELAWLVDPGLPVKASRWRKIQNRAQSLWVVLFLINLCFLIYMTILASKIMEWHENSHDALTTPHEVIWHYLLLSVSFGIIFRWRLEIEKEC
jgi:hypothetical protein